MRVHRKSLTSRDRLHALTAAAVLTIVAGLTGSAHGAVASSKSVHSQTKSVAAIQPLTKGVADPVSPQGKPGQGKTGAHRPAAAPSLRQLHPMGVPGGQSSYQLTAAELKNARTIVRTGKRLGLPPRAWVIAIATSMQESKLNNLGNLGSANDHDSLGLFQQRPSSGWGTPAEVTDPVYASTKFYRALTGVGGWQRMPLSAAAQSVQVSAFPDAYAQWEGQAGDVVRGCFGQGPYAHQLASLR